MIYGSTSVEIFNQIVLQDCIWPFYGKKIYETISIEIL